MPVAAAVAAAALSLQPFWSLKHHFAAANPATPQTSTAAPLNTATMSVHAVASPVATAASRPTTATIPSTVPATNSPTLGLPSTSTPSTVPIAEPAPQRHFVVLIVIDANRPIYNEMAKLPHIGALMRHGMIYDRAWVGELESSTPDVHVTFGTGTLPRENGFLGFGWAAPQTRKTVDFRTLLANGQIDPVLQALPVPSVAARLHQYMPNAASIAASGHKDYAVVGLGGGAASYELYGRFGTHQFTPTFLHSPPPLTPRERRSLVLPLPLKLGAEDSWGFHYASMVARHVHPHLLMINVPEMDTWGHWYGPSNTRVMNTLIHNVDRGVGQIERTYRQLGILNRTDFIITADHSMMESHGARNWGAVQSLAKTVGAQVVRADGEGGAVWLQNPAQARAVADAMVAAHPLHVEAIFYRSGLGLDYRYQQASPASWLVGPRVSTALSHLVDTTAGRNGPDVWVIYHENYTVVPRNVQGQWKGTHGGSTWKVQHIPLILSGPGIVHGHSQFPARAVDIAPTMERLLGLPPIQRDGVALADAMTDASRHDVIAQRALMASLTDDVTALQSQSAVDDRNQQRWLATPPSPLGCVFAPAVAVPPQRSCQIISGVATNQ